MKMHSKKMLSSLGDITELLEWNPFRSKEEKSIHNSIHQIIRVSETIIKAGSNFSDELNRTDMTTKEISASIELLKLKAQKIDEHIKNMEEQNKKLELNKTLNSL